MFVRRIRRTYIELSFQSFAHPDEPGGARSNGKSWVIEVRNIDETEDAHSDVVLSPVTAMPSHNNVGRAKELCDQ